MAPLFTRRRQRLATTPISPAPSARAFIPPRSWPTFGRAKRSHSHELPLNFKLILLAGTYAHDRYNGRLYAKAQNVRPTIFAQYQEAFRSVDLLAMPTCPVKSLPITPTDHVDAIERTLFGGRRGLDLGPVIANTCPFNYTGHPALSIPCAKSNGLPIGLMLVAPYFREDVLFQAAAAYQQSVDWVALISTPAAGAKAGPP